MSYAIIQTGGKQYKVKASEILKIEQLENLKPESKIEFNEILAYGDDKNIEVGSPLVKGAKVEAELLKNGKTVRALSRNPQKTEFPENVEVIKGDLNNIETLTKAFEGVHAAHFISIGDEKYTPPPPCKGGICFTQGTYTSPKLRAVRN